MMPYTGPKEYKPLSPWAYFGLSVLYAIPVVGLVFLIIFSFNKKNINRRSFTRSYWCGLILVAALIALTAALNIATGTLDQVLPTIQNAIAGIG